MQRRSASGNMRFGIILTLLAFLMLCVAFIWAALYLASAHG
ncbi:MAG: hypothetical protein M0T72_09540 [Candidatus Dormibacteraeota bacterium]|nr:hypothetical protein [Candidatus Dormibacteraeota bacterium]